MRKTFNKFNLSFMSTQWFIWAGLAIYYPFFVPYLKSSGYNEINIGIISSVLSVVGIIGPILWGAVSDRLKNTKAILAINLLAGCICMQFIPVAVSNYGILLAVLIIVNFTVFPQTCVMDGWIMRLKGRGAPINYGLIRGTGSLAYAVTSMAAGLILTRFGLATMFPLMLGFQCFAVLFILLVKKNPETGAGSAAMDLPVEPEAPIHKNGPFIVFVLLATLLYIGNTATMNFYWILLESAGGTPANLGLAMGIMALSEFPVMFLSNKLLSKYKDTSLLLVAMGFYALRIFLFYAMHSVSGIVWAQLTNSLSFGIFLPTSVHYISRITPGRTKATALSLASSMYMGASGILGNLLGGFVIDYYGIRTLYGGAAALAAVVTVAFGVVLLLSKRKQATQINAAE